MRRSKTELAENLAKDKEMAEKAPIILNENTARLLSAQVPAKPPLVAKERALGTATSTDRKRLPKITITYYNKKGDMVSEEYVCSSIQIGKNQDTTLVGEGAVASRRDLVNISIEAQVVEVI